MKPSKFRELIDRLDQVEADLRSCENRVTRVRLDLLKELHPSVVAPLPEVKK